MQQKGLFSKSDIAAVTKLLEEREHCRIEYNEEMSGVWFHDPYLETELRILCLYDIRLTVSRVCFQNRRQGTMTAGLKYLTEFCVRNHVATIVIQSVETPEMAAWCRKNGFLPDPNSTFPVNGTLLGDYCKPVVSAI